MTKPELAATPFSLEARLDVLAVRGGQKFLHALFGPLGYEVEASRYPLDEQFPEWGESPYFSVTVRKKTTLHELLTHLYVLIPVFDPSKHYYVGEDQIERLLEKGAGWLGTHPEKEEIARRYLRIKPSLFSLALRRLVGDDAHGQEETTLYESDKDETTLEQPLSLNAQRLTAVKTMLLASGAKRILDIGCGEGKLIVDLLKEQQVKEIVGMDVSIRMLECAARRLKLDDFSVAPTLSQSEGVGESPRVKLIHGSLMYRDKRLAGYDAAAVVEVIEHLDPSRLSSFARVLFKYARPEMIVLTTPNHEYNVVWGALPPGQFRHPDHRFEWTRDQFQTWAINIAARYKYQVRFHPVGPEHPEHGSPTQMGVFERL